MTVFCSSTFNNYILTTSNFDCNSGFSNLGYTYPRHYVTGVRKKCVDNEKLSLTFCKGKVWSVNLFHIAELQTVPLDCARKTALLKLPCKTWWNGVAEAQISCFHLILTKLRFHLILTKPYNLLNVKCKPNSDPKVNPKSNKKNKVKPCLLN